MADRSQHAGQIMETQTRYNLNAAIENWRQEMASQANLTAEVRRELETHLHDAIAGFQHRGLNDEESFLLARHRVGQPQKLNEEFMKSDFIRAWRERVFWMANALLLFSLWGNLARMFWLRFSSGNTRHFVSLWRLEDSLPDWILFYLPHWLREFPNIPFSYLYNVLPSMVFIVLCMVFAASTRLQKGAGFFGFIFQSRTRFIAFALLSFSAVTMASSLIVSNNLNGLTTTPMILLLTYNFPWTFSLIGLIAWLLPSQNPKTPKRA